MDSRIFINGRIHPQNVPEVFSVMAVCGKKIAYIGNDVAEAKNAVEPEAPVSDAHGHVIIPAFVDSHTHPSCIALTNWRVPLKGNTLEELLEDAAAYCREHSPEEVPYFFGESFQLTMLMKTGPGRNSSIGIFPTGRQDCRISPTTAAGITALRWKPWASVQGSRIPRSFRERWQISAEIQTALPRDGCWRSRMTAWTGSCMTGSDGIPISCPPGKIWHRF